MPHGPSVAACLPQKASETAQTRKNFASLTVTSAQAYDPELRSEYVRSCDHVSLSLENISFCLERCTEDGRQEWQRSEGGATHV